MEDSNNILIKCVDNCSCVSLDKFKDEDAYYLTFYTSFEGKSLIERLKNVWDFIKGKDLTSREIIIKEKDFDKIRTFNIIPLESKRFRSKHEILYSSSIEIEPFRITKIDNKISENEKPLIFISYKNEIWDNMDYIYKILNNDIVLTIHLKDIVLGGDDMLFDKLMNLLKIAKQKQWIVI